MPVSKRRAGQNVRALEVKRRVKAISSFAAAGIIVGFPFVFFNMFEELLQNSSSLNSYQTQPATSVPPMVYGLCFIAALSCIVNGVFSWRLANRAAQGAKGEEEMARVMSQLAREGWQIEYGMLLGNRLGDADIVCISPQNKAYVIDVKSHRGEIQTDGTQLYRRMGRQKFPFKKNLLDQALKQAIQVKKQKNLRFVTPVVAFSDAKVSVPHGKLQKVYVVEKSRLIALLKSLG